jgi:hypothetical protein
MPDLLHPTRQEIRGVLLDEVAAERGLEIAEHLESGCEDCAMVMLAELGSLLRAPGDGCESCELEEPEAEPDLDVYDQAIDRALVSSRRIAGRTRRELARVAEALALLTGIGCDAFLREVPRRLSGVAGFEALLARSREVRHVSEIDSSESVRLAGAAVVWAGRLPARRYGVRQVADFQCRAWLELAESQARAGSPALAREAVAEAARLFQDGTGDDELEARLRETQALLDAGSTAAGRALISRGIAAGFRGRPEEAAHRIAEGLALLDKDRDADLVLAAVHSLLHLLVHLGRFRETRALLFEYRPAFQAAVRRAGRVS